MGEQPGGSITDYFFEDFFLQISSSSSPVTCSSHATKDDLRVFPGSAIFGVGVSSHLFFELFSLAVLRERDENNDGRNKLFRRLQYIAFLLPSVLCLLS